MSSMLIDTHPHPSASATIALHNGATQLTSAASVLSLLEESDPTLKAYALSQLAQDSVINGFWHEIADILPKIIEPLCEDEEFKDRALACVVASKVFYHLEELDLALKYALGAGTLFDLNERTEYVNTLVSYCIDTYVKLRVKASESKKGDAKAEADVKIDDRLERIVNRMFDRCYLDGEYKQALGIAIESRRLDQVNTSITQSGDVEGMLAYCFQLSQKHVINRDFRKSLLARLVALYKGLEVPDYISMCQCLLFLDDPAAVAKIVDQLIKQDTDSALMAFQVAFDLCENQNQPFLTRVAKLLPDVPVPADTPAAASASNTTAAASPSASAAAKPAATPTAGGPAAMDTSEKAVAAAAAAEKKEKSEKEKADEKEADTYPRRLKNLKDILAGNTSMQLQLQFLYGQNRTDQNILKQVKDKLEPRNNITHNALVMSHAIMNVGTTSDTFLRDNLDWLGKATNWAKFIATSSIGVIHRGHYDQSIKLLTPYLPQHGQSGSPYQEGGALFALGLIHANHSNDKTDFLLEALRNAGNNEIVQHGCCLGLGLTAMATADQAIFDTLKEILYTESAVSGEAAGLAMGLVLLGSGNGEALQEMVTYAHQTKHEKIIRGLALGIAMIVYGREEEADTLIEQLLRDKDSILRYGGMYAIAMAYVGTANNSAVRKLLHVAVSDVSDDVRRAAVAAIGFVLCNVPQQVPRIVALLSESYNPHVRYGACLAVGTACAGSGFKEALNLLEPLSKDRVDFVRQGALLAQAMVLIQHNDVKEPKVKAIRKQFFDSLSLKGDTMTKVGAVLAMGIIDAGGRNQTISLLSPAGHKKMAAIVGMALFPQFWYWYPFVHFISLAFTSTAVIGLNKQMRMPKSFTSVSNAKPSLFAYPSPQVFKKEEEKKALKKATLSVTAKAKARTLKRQGSTAGAGAAGDDTDMKTGETPKATVASPAAATTAATGTVAATPAGDEKDVKSPAAGDDKDKEKEKEKEPEFEVLKNPARVTAAQQALISYDKAQRYIPVKQRLWGIVMLKDSKPDEGEDLVIPSAPKIGVPGISDDEPDAPEPFEFRRN